MRIHFANPGQGAGIRVKMNRLFQSRVVGALKPGGLSLRSTVSFVFSSGLDLVRE